MIKKAIQIGKDEKHIAEVIISQFTGKTIIRMDGIEILSTHMLSSKIFNFSIGQNEKHNVVISIGGVLIPKVEFYVDIDSNTLSSMKSKSIRRNTVSWIILLILSILAGVAGYIGMQILLHSLFG